MRSPSALAPLLAMAVLGLPAPAAADAPDPVHGRELHERHCVDCHADRMGGDPTSIYDRANRRVGSLDALYDQVGRCRNSYGEAWPHSWVEDVTTWLNGQFYHFGPLDPGQVGEEGSEGREALPEE